MPGELSSFAGREHELAALRDLLVSERLLTLVGVGGVGKARVVLPLARESLANYPDGEWLVELAPLAEPSLDARAAASALGILEQPKRPVQSVLIDALNAKHMLLGLDNCEHLAGRTTRLVGRLVAGSHGPQPANQVRGGAEHTRICVPPAVSRPPACRCQKRVAGHGPAASLSDHWPPFLGPSVAPATPVQVPAALFQVHERTGSSLGLESAVRGLRASLVELGADAVDVESAPLRTNLDRVIHKIRRRIGGTAVKQVLVVSSQVCRAGH